MSDTISFDKVDAPTPAACAVCTGSLAPAYFSVNGKPLCAACRQMVLERLERGPLLPRLFFAVAVGGVVSVGGAILSHVITAATGYSFALITILVGIGVGAMVRRSSRGGGRGWQALAVFLTYASFSLATLPGIRDALVASQRDPDLATVLAFFMCWFTPVFFMMDSVVHGLLNLLILFFGLQAAWRATKRVQLDITGPFPAAAPPTATEAAPAASVDVTNVAGT